MSENKEKRATVSRNAVILLVLLIVATAVVFTTYRVLLNFYYFEFVLIAYMAIETVFIFTYLIYNRGMSRRGITPEMLPAEWSEEQKREFIEDGKERLKKSKWMLIIIFAFFFTFTVDLIELIVIPFFAGIFAS